MADIHTILENAVLNCIKNNPNQSIRGIARILNLDRIVVGNAVKSLLERGKIKNLGQSRFSVLVVGGDSNG